MSVHTATAAPWQAGLRGARANLLPGLALQAFALGLVLAYYWHAPTRAALEHLATWRAQTGVLFGIVSTGFFGGLLPVLYLRARRATRTRYTAAQGTTLTLFWAYKGLEIGLWYQVLAYAVGEDNRPTTILIKMVLDQLVYCPLYAVPLTAILYEWCESRFDTAATLRDLRTPRWYVRRVLPMLISNIGVWVPAVCIVYALPTPLQLPLQNVVLCFFTLMLAHMAQRPSDSPTNTDER